MSGSELTYSEIHWMIEMFQNVDVGLVVFDRDYRIHVWNGFMENHSGLSMFEMREKLLFDMRPEVDEEWFRHKAEPVFKLRNRAFTIWEQRKYIFKFRNYRPITGSADVMYQNATFIPLADTRGEVKHVCLLVYDVTDVAINKVELEKANRELERLSRTDALTQLNNRGFWEEQLKQEFGRCQRRGDGTSALLMFDIDHFKQINDGFGHAAGDLAIQQCADVVKQNLRETDIAGRYGGEEFAVILVDTNSENAKVFAERIRKAVENITVKYNTTVIQFTISVGIAEFSEQMTSHTRWIAAADSALYHSKQNGRNKVSAFRFKDA